MVRTYGQAPYTHAVIHGGPGAIGSMACVAEVLAGYTGVIEPLQSQYTIAELPEELHRQLQEKATLPATLIGHSWGAWLASLYK